MSTTDFIAAIEIGSSKIAGIAGRKNNDGSIQVLAYAKEKSSSFVRKGVIFNLDKAAQALASVINKLEDSLNSSIGKAYVGISGQSLHTVRNTITRDLVEETIVSQELIDSICDENIAIPLVDMEILDVAPQEYKIGMNLQADPVGVAGSNIEGRFLNIVARASLKKNLEHSFQQAKIPIADILISPLVTANVVLTEPEMRSGCALIDFGADTTTVSVYKNNILRFLTVVPLGGNTITTDITSLQMEEEEAEALKKEYGNVMPREEQEPEAITIQLEDSGREVELHQLNNIIEARAEELVANALNQIELSGFEDKLLAGIVITGGGINLKNMDELLKRKGKIKKIRTATFVRYEVHAPVEVLVKDGMRNTLLGLLNAGKENCYQPKKEEIKQPEEIVIPETLFDNDEELLKQEAQIKEEKRKKEQEEKKRKEEERKRKQEEKKNKTSWFKNTFDKLSNEIFSDEDMK